MARKCFFSFHFNPDNWRASQVREIGSIEGNSAVSDNAWEEITQGGDKEIQKWIDGQMKGKSCVVVLIGTNTAKRKWINYEIIKAWKDRKGVVGIYIHKLKNRKGDQATKGKNPFDYLNLGDEPLSNTVKAYNPAGSTSKEAYKTIADNIENWVETAISIRENY